MYVQKNAKYLCEVRSHIMLTTGIHHFAINGNSNAIYFYYSINERIMYMYRIDLNTTPQDSIFRSGFLILDCYIKNA